jgi:hypothetical protein
MSESVLKNGLSQIGRVGRQQAEEQRVRRNRELREQQGHQRRNLPDQCELRSKQGGPDKPPTKPPTAPNRTPVMPKNRISTPLHPRKVPA